jgi:hypothetical protein
MEPNVCSETERFDAPKLDVVSSLDSSFAIEKLVRDHFSRAKDTLSICVPWFDKGFVSLMMRTVPPDVSVNVMTKIPQENDKTFCAARALETEGRWKTDIVCAPWLHAKFYIVDSKDVIFGSANGTGNGFYYNNEVLVGVSDAPEVAVKFLKIFNEIKSQPQNLKWSIVREYSGCSSYSTPQLRIMKLVEEFFRKNSNAEIQLPLLVRFVQNSGYEFEITKQTIQEMVRFGTLYMPRDSYVRHTPT